MGIGLSWLFAAVLALPVGQGAAFAVRGEGFVWPGVELGQSLLGLFAGDPGRGLSPDLRSVLPPAGLVYAAVVAIETALAAASILGFSWWLRTVGPLAQFGMARRHDVVAVLGRSQLMRRRTTIRPDLAGRGR